VGADVVFFGSETDLQQPDDESEVRRKSVLIRGLENEYGTGKKFGPTFVSGALGINSSTKDNFELESIFLPDSPIWIEEESKEQHDKLCAG
jgi:hypothetical protein